MNLRGRVEALCARLRPGRLCVIMPSADGPSASPLENASGLVLHVPLEYESDPKAGLTDAQRRMIGEHDQLIVIMYEDRRIYESREYEGHPDDAA